MTDEQIKLILEIISTFAIVAASITAIYGINAWKREYRFKRNSELLEEALVLFYQAEHAIAYLRNSFIFSNDLQDFEFPSELEGEYSKEKYKYTHTIRNRFGEKQDVFSKLYSIELRFRARFGTEPTKAFNDMRGKVKELLFAADRYSMKGLSKDEIIEVQKIIWGGFYKKSKEGDVFGNEVSKIVGGFDKMCRKIIER